MIYESIKEVLLWADVDADTADKAAQNLASGKSSVIAVTGKLASGKDTIAPLLMHRLFPGKPIVHAYFARALKSEVTEAMQFINNLLNSNQYTYEEIAQALSVHSDITVSQARVVTDALAPELFSSSPPKDAWERTPGIRRVLQYWGTDIRRKKDDAYWVKKSLKLISPDIATGSNIFVTDARFSNESDALSSLGGYLTRLVITFETQDRRLMSRDGLQLSDEARFHASETELDTYDKFDLLVDNNADGTQSIEKVLDQLVEGFHNKRKNLNISTN